MSVAPVEEVPIPLTLEEKVDLMLEQQAKINLFIDSLNKAIEAMADNPMLQTLGFSLPKLG